MNETGEGTGPSGGTGVPSLGKRPGRRARGGFTLAEMALAMTILMVALMSISAATLRSHSLRRQNRERVVAQNALRSMSERVHAVSLEKSADPSTWAKEVIEVFSDDGDVGDTFEVQGLTPIDDSTPVGTVEFITDETATDDELNLELGMPRDLNGDGASSSTDVTANARLLPVVVTVQWEGNSGVVRLRHPFFILGY